MSPGRGWSRRLSREVAEWKMDVDGKEKHMRTFMDVRIQGAKMMGWARPPIAVS